MAAVTEEPQFPFARRNDPLDPPAEYAHIRLEGPVRKARLWNGQNVWLVTRWTDVRQVLSSPHVSSDVQRKGYPSLSPGRTAQITSRNTFINMDPPAHTHYRRMLTKEFTLKRMTELRPSVQAIVDRLLDAMIDGGAPADIVTSLARPLPATVISTMLGVPARHYDDLRQWTEIRNDFASDPDEVRTAADSMMAVLDEVLKEKEAHPGDGADLLARLAIEYINTGELPHDEAVRIATFLYMAGHSTTASQLTLGLLSLLQHPDQFSMLVKQPTLVRGAIEEMLRFHTIAHFNAARVATAPMSVGGATIDAGDGIFALLLAANRDPATFPHPDTFDIARSPNPHMAFSFGIHQCLGQPLARLELDVALSSLIKRLPGLKLAMSADELKFTEMAQVFSVETLNVAW
jgi:cytochrome P450